MDPEGLDAKAEQLRELARSLRQRTEPIVEVMADVVPYCGPETWRGPIADQMDAEFEGWDGRLESAAESVTELAAACDRKAGALEDQAEELRQEERRREERRQESEASSGRTPPR